MNNKQIKEWFQHALIQGNLNFSTFGESLRPPVSRVMISRVLSGHVKSPRVERAILDFIREKLPLIHARLDNLKSANHELYVDAV